MARQSEHRTIIGATVAINKYRLVASVHNMSNECRMVQTLCYAKSLWLVDHIWIRGLDNVLID